MRTSEQTTTLLAALVMARAAFKPITKDATAQMGKDRPPIKYADLAAILEAIQPALSANALVLLQSIDAETSSLITRLAHTSGEWVESVYPLKLELTPQAFGSALTYGRRYSISSLLCLSAADDDGADAEKAKPAPKAKPAALAKPADATRISEPQRKRLFVIASNAGWTHAHMKTYLHRHVGIDHTSDIRRDQYDQLCDVFGTPFEPEGDHV